MSHPEFPSRRDFHKACLALAVSALAAPAKGVTTEAEPAGLYLNRLTFGATPSDLTDITQKGLDAWLDRQLYPQEDPDLEVLINNVRLLIEYEAGKTGQGAPWEALSEMRPISYLNTPAAELLKFLDFSQGIAWEERVRPAREIISLSTIRATHSQNQLAEVMAHFWHEHFSVNALKDEVTAIYFPAYDRVIRTHALGNFRALLGDVAKSPAMLAYLNNDASRASPANENYARELLELHTLGAEHYFNDLYDDWKAVPGARDGKATGYIDQDVYEVARAFTGWTIGDGRWLGEGTHAPETGEFLYVEAWHDPYQKRVLGEEFAPNSGPMEDGERVLDMLAAHPATAKFIAGKLLSRLGIERPSPDYLETIAKTFHAARDSSDQIAQTVRAIVLHQEFASTPPQKLKRPFEYLISMYRMSGAAVSNPRYNVHWWLQRAGWAQHQVRPPTGHSDNSADWSNTRSLNGMVDLALYAHDDWFDVAEIDFETISGRPETWGGLVEFWMKRFGASPEGAKTLLSSFDIPLDAPIGNDAGARGFGHRSAITMAALSPQGLFR